MIWTRKYSVGSSICIHILTLRNKMMTSCNEIIRHPKWTCSILRNNCISVYDYTIRVMFSKSVFAFHHVMFKIVNPLMFGRPIRHLCSMSIFKSAISARQIYFWRLPLVLFVIVKCKYTGEQTIFYLNLR